MNTKLTFKELIEAYDDDLFAQSAARAHAA